MSYDAHADVLGALVHPKRIFEEGKIYYLQELFAKVFLSLTLVQRSDLESILEGKMAQEWPVVFNIIRKIS